MFYNSILNDKEIQKRFKEIDENDKSDSNHGMRHALNVVKNVEKLSNILNVDKVTEDYLKIAAYVHDLGQKYGKDEHVSKSVLIAQEVLKDRIDAIWYKKIIKAIKLHHEKDYISSLDLFEHILLFADKMDFASDRIVEEYSNKASKNYYIQSNIESVDYLIDNNIFIVQIKLKNNLTEDEFKTWNFYSKIKKRIEEFAYKLDLDYKIIYI